MAQICQKKHIKMAFYGWKRSKIAKICSKWQKIESKLLITIAKLKMKWNGETEKS